MTTSYFRETRNIELSIIDHIETKVATAWSGVTITKSFTSAYSLPRPVICIGLIGGSQDRLEIGANTLNKEYTISINVFAKHDGQRIDLADYLVDLLKDGWTYYIFSHSTGDNTKLDKTSAGKCRVVSWVDNARIDLGDEMEAADRFRHLILIRVKKGK